MVIYCIHPNTSKLEPRFAGRPPLEVSLLGLMGVVEFFAAYVSAQKSLTHFIIEIPGITGLKYCIIGVLLSNISHSCSALQSKGHL